MKLVLERPQVEAMVQAFPHLAPLSEQLRLGNRVEAPLSRFGQAELAFLRDLYAGLGDPGHAARAGRIEAVRQALADDGVRFGGEDLEPLVPAMARYLAEGARRGWLFSSPLSAKPQAWVVIPSTTDP